MDGSRNACFLSFASVAPKAKEQRTKNKKQNEGNKPNQHHPLQ
jgi:hypothetical protein